jgi:glutathione S-transferase
LPPGCRSARARLYAIPGSHPCAAVAALLDTRGVDYERVDLVPVLSRFWLRALGFGGSTVPALRIDGRRIVGSRAIMHALGEQGEEEIETWADETLQCVVRRIVLWCLARHPAATASVLADARLHPPLPRRLARRLAPFVLRIDARLNAAGDAAVHRDLAALREHLDRIDAWIARGGLGGEPPTAADYQVARSVRLLLVFDDLAPLLGGRPAAELARRIIPRFEGRVPAGAFPPAWLPRV